MTLKEESQFVDIESLKDGTAFIFGEMFGVVASHDDNYCRILVFDDNKRTASKDVLIFGSKVVRVAIVNVSYRVWPVAEQHTTTV